MLRKLLPVTLGLLLAGAVAAGPAQAVGVNRLGVYPIGVWTSPSTGNISGAATCAGGIGVVTFTTEPGTPYTVSGQTEVVCDGVQHDWAATIAGGPYTRDGVIVFRATLTAPSGTTRVGAKVILR
jgi:hypothetical protein